MSLHFELLGEYAAWTILGMIMGYIIRMAQDRFKR